ncbi:DUF418 domain-containing protein [Chloroflexus sp.]|uniref:DUF418 domain-containing protein n=1 Tax=Chloroflexus sp. TaxID=1904827 RepID=UPI002ACD5CC4|nr:DUF418 domain-containing protein [Chloroflexus sp.]
MTIFSAPFQSLLFPVPAGTPWYDRVALWLIHFLGEGKFYALFSMLFGMGMVLQMERIEDRGGHFVGLYARRLLILLVIGIIHAFLIWPGDILIPLADRDHRARHWRAAADARLCRSHLLVGVAASVGTTVTRARALGQMALSNYLLQSIICIAIFYGYSLALFGKVGTAAGIALTIVIYALQIPISHWWLRRFRYGPVEWLWRSGTYLKRQPLRRG